MMDNWANDKEFLETFSAEAEERLRNLSEGLMELENSSDNEELIKRLFRDAHTLKGSAGMMGLTSIKEIAHKAEDILSSVQSGQIEIDQGVTDLLLESLDRMQELLPSADKPNDPEADVSELLDRLEKVDINGGVKSKSRNEAVQPAKPDIEEENIEQHEEHEEKDTAAISQPEPVSNAKAKKAATASTTAMEAKSDPTIRVNIERLDKLLNLMGEILVNQMDDEGQIKELSYIQNQTKEMRTIFSSLVEQAESLKQNAGPDELASFSEKLNTALDGASGVADSLESTAAHLKDNTASRRLALDELQDRTLHVRMLPLSTIFGHYARVVRDASNTSGKKVCLVIEGEKTELDKRILEQITDPIIHILRNCVDHGIESPQARVDSGKPEQGTVRITASQRGDRVDIEIEDDGAGINPQKIRESAVQKKIISAGDELTEEEAMALIFRPGFSTAEIITDISGRGVGLDVVKNNIEKLEGYVSMESIPGSGTRFTVSLPVTLAVIAGLLVECNNAKFIIPLGSVKEMVALEEKEIQAIGGHKGFLMRENAIPLLDILNYLGGPALESETDKTQVVIVGSGRRLLGLHVGRLIGEQEVVIKPLGRFLERHRSVAGVTILGNGEVVIVLNINELVRSVREGTGIAIGGTSKVQAVKETEEQKKSVLVVDDSLVIRELQRNILEAAGYEVQTAIDGQDALARLNQETIDCVVTDLDMPRMDGFDLTSTIRNMADLTLMPVIIVSSKSSDEDKRKGIEVGANAYVVKGTFNQQSLLDTIERLVA